jgi:hypothetical protein
MKVVQDQMQLLDLPRIDENEEEQMRTSEIHHISEETDQ